LARCEWGFLVRTMKDQSHRRLIGVTILLGYLLFFLADLAAAVEAASKDLGRIRVEDRPAFTRIVFPCDRPENSSVEPDPERSRFVVRLQATATGVTPPSLSKGHHLIKRIEILPDPKTGVQVQVILEDNLVDWVSYRYERPPRTVLYLRARSDFGRSKGSTRSSDSQRTGGVTAEKTAPTLTEQAKTRSQPGQASDLAKARSAKPVGKGMEELWRPSAEHIPEFVRLGQVYPPDFPEMKENQRRLYRQALEMMDSIARSYLDENRDEEALRVSLLLGESFGRDGLGGMR